MAIRSDGHSSYRPLAIEPATDGEGRLRQLFEHVYSVGDLDASSFVAPDLRLTCRGTGDHYRGVSGVKGHASRLRSTFAGLTITLDEFTMTADGFLAEFRATGRFERPFGGIEPKCVIGAAGEEPSGPTVTLPGRVSGTVADGRLQAVAFDWNLDALRVQNGVDTPSIPDFGRWVRP